MNPPLPAPRVRVRRLPATAGLSWIVRAWRTFRRQPLGFLGLFGMFLMLLVAVQLPVALLIPLLEALHLGTAFVPLLGVVLLPLLSLGFMIGTEAATNDLRVRPQFLFIALARSPQARRSLGALGLAYLALVGLAAIAGNGLDGGEAQRWLVARLTASSAAALAATADLSDAGAGVLSLKAALVALGSVPLWHAPALVHWGRQRTLPALFGSVVALWRTKAAFTLFLVSWFGFGLVSSLLLAALSTVLGDFAFVVATVLGSWVMTALFYITLWFGFEDTFEIAVPPAPAPSSPAE